VRLEKERIKPLGGRKGERGDLGGKAASFKLLLDRGLPHDEGVVFKEGIGFKGAGELVCRKVSFSFPSCNNP